MRGQLRRVTTLVAAASTVITLAMVLVGSWDDWRFERDWGLLNAGNALYVLGPILLGAACLEASLRRRSIDDFTVGWRLAIRSVWPSAVVLFLVTLMIWLIVGVGSFVVLLASEALGTFRWEGLVNQILGIGAFIGAGSLIGVLVPRLWTAPLAALVVYGVTIFIPFDMSDLFPSAPATYISGYRLPPGQLIWTSILYAFVIALMIPKSTGSDGEYLRSRVPLLLMTALTGAIAFGQNPFYEFRAEPADRCLAASSLDIEGSTLCTSEVYQGRLDLVAREIRMASHPILGLGVDLPAQIVVRSQANPTPGGSGALVIQVNPAMLSPDWVPDGGENTLRSEVIRKVAIGSCAWWYAEEPPSDSLSVGSQMTFEWLADELGEGIDRFLPEVWYRADPGYRDHVVARLLEATYACDDAAINRIVERVEIDLEGT